MTPRRQLIDLNFLGWVFCAAVFVIAVHQLANKSHPRDFVYFYSIGHILNHYSPERLYDFSLQKEIFNRILPATDGEYGPSPYPPYVALLFRPLALLPFWIACLIWMALSLAMYLTGLLLLVRRFFAGDPLRQSILFCFALSLWTFLGRTLMNGQLSAIGFLAVAVAICFEEAGRPYLSGLALAVCAYKPTLLLLIVPMLLVTRRLKTLFGLLAAGVALASVTTLLEGPRVWGAYVRLSTQFPHFPFLASDHVDIPSFARLIAHGSAPVEWLTLGLAFPVGLILARIWWLDARSAIPLPAQLLWGTTLTWTLLLNVYVPLYDTVLAAISIILTARVLSQYSHRVFVAICISVVASSYVSRLVAEATGIQLMTVSLAALGTLQMALCLRTLTSGNRLLTPEAQQGLQSHDRQGVLCANVCK